jgi:CBS domain-containing protein
MEKEERGACAVLEVDKLVGVFSERDLMLRVIAKGCDPQGIGIADVPPPTTPAEASVAEALQVMEKEERGACAVLENICVRDVMSQNLYTVNSKTESAEALSLMMSQSIRHLPVVDDEGNLAGLLSMRDLVRHQVEELTDELNSIVAYFSADGPGG